MRYKLMFLLLFTSCYSLAQGNADFPEIPDRDTYNVEGNVQRLKESFIDSTGALVLEREIVFDTAGRADTVITNETDGKISRVTAYEYNDHGKLLTIVIYNEGKTQDSTSFVYNREGQLRKIFLFDRNGLNKITKYNYSKGRLAYIRNEDGGHRLLNMVRFKYKGAGEYERTTFDDQLRFSFRQLFTIEKDATGNKTVSCYHYAAPDSCTGTVSKVYDEKGQLISQVTTGADKRVTDYIENSYTPDGHLSEQTIFTDRKQQIGYTYQFDTAGNWIERKAYDEGMLKETVIRGIDYTDASTAISKNKNSDM